MSIAHRTKGPKDVIKQSKAEFIQGVQEQLDEIQATLFKRAKAFQKENIVEIDSKDDFYAFFKGKGGFAYAHWNGDPKVEEQVQQDLGVTIRCIPFNGEKKAGLLCDHR